MGEKESKWLEHLKAAQSSDLKLSAYAANHQIDVRRLYEAKRKRAQQAASNWALVRLKPDPPAQATPKAREWVALLGSRGQKPGKTGFGVELGWPSLIVERTLCRQAFRIF